jgi:thiosulfate/3-mercaptopyruvate sulfurtransferase
VEITCRVYRPRKPREPPLYELVERYLEQILHLLTTDGGKTAEAPWEPLPEGDGLLLRSGRPSVEPPAAGGPGGPATSRQVRQNATMNAIMRRPLWAASGLLLLAGSVAAQSEPAKSGFGELIQPEELAAILKSPKEEKPLLLHVGFHVLYVQAHIPGSEYHGPASSPDGLEELRKRVESLPRTTFIVVYCGCCPWVRCPNMKPASELLREMGFTNVRLLYIGENLGADWVARGYPVASGE